MHRNEQRSQRIEVNATFGEAANDHLLDSAALNLEPMINPFAIDVGCALFLSDDSFQSFFFRQLEEFLPATIDMLDIADNFRTVQDLSQGLFAPNQRLTPQILSVQK